MSKLSERLPELWAEIYAGLAQALAPPGMLLSWFAAPGNEWPLFEAASTLAARFPSRLWAEAVVALSEVPASSLTARQAEYESLFMGRGRPAIWLYEAHYVHGRIPGPVTFTVKNLYKQVGLETAGAELPDHATLELDFLAFLAEQETRGDERQWWTARRLFVKKHAGRWLPAVGEALAGCPYPAWVAIGRLLTATLRGGVKRQGARPAWKGLPQIVTTYSGRGDCNLCGFCVQVCPTRAFRIHEDDHTTALRLSPAQCVYCEKCVRVCPEKILELRGENTSDDLFRSSAPVMLRQSPRAICPCCGASTVSLAELEAVAAKIGNPAWLAYCLGCR